MEVSQSTKEYFSNLSKRTSEYHTALGITKDFIVDNEIIETEKIVDFMIMSVLWVAATLGETLTEEDICVFLNIESTPIQNSIQIEIMPEIKNWSLQDVLQYVHGTHGLI